MENNVEDRLDTIFKNVNDWLKFAEQKNAALIVLNTGIIWGVSRILSKELFESLWVFAVGCIGYFCTIISIIICIISFMPVLTGNWFKIGKKKPEDNLLFFCDIAKYSQKNYLELVAVKLNLENYKFSNIEKDYASQIVNNSEITLEKYKRFKLSSTFTIGGIVFFILSITIGLIRNSL